MTILVVYGLRMASDKNRMELFVLAVDGQKVLHSIPLSEIKISNNSVLATDEINALQAAVSS